MICIFLFFNRTRHPLMNCFTFSKHFKHVDLYANNGKGWVGFRLTREGLLHDHTGQIIGGDLVKLCAQQPTAEAVIAVEVKGRAYFPWRPLTIPMCNEVARLISGINVGFTWNPRHLYSKLLKYDRLRNYEVIYQWRRSEESSLKPAK